MPFTLLKPSHDFEKFRWYGEIPQLVSIRFPNYPGNCATLRSITARFRIRFSAKYAKREKDTTVSVPLEWCLRRHDIFWTRSGRQPDINELADVLSKAAKHSERHSGYGDNSHELSLSQAASLLAAAGCPVPPEQLASTASEIRDFANTRLPTGFVARIEIVPQETSKN